jgi:hypothetical protein
MGQSRVKEDYPKIRSWCSELLQSYLPKKVKLIGIVISGYYNPGELTYPTHEMIAKDCSIESINTIRIGINTLEEAGFIVTKKVYLPNTNSDQILYFFRGVNDHAIPNFTN